MKFTQMAMIAAISAGSAMPLVLASKAAAAPAAARPMTNFEAQARAMLQSAYPGDGPGAAVVVMKGGRLLFAGSRGLANVESNRPITTGTAFPLGSIVKQFTAAAVLKLVADGKMSLDDPVSRFFPDWPQPSASATVRQLLNHSSGIQDFSKIPGWIARNRDKAWTTEQLLAVFRDLPPRAKPGEAWEYNNGGYVLLGAILENVAGTPWHEVVTERVTRPLGLASILYADSPQAARTMARGYTEDGDGRKPVHRASWSLAHAAGGLVGSVDDLAKWAEALHHGKVVPAALYKEMTSPARLADGSTRPYGFGLRLQQVRGQRAFVHGGAGAGLDTDSVYIPSEDLFVAVFANSDEPAIDPSTLTRRLAALAMGRPFPTFTRAEVAAKDIEPLFGLYAGDSGEPLRFSSRDGKLFVGQGDGEMEALPAGDDRFFFGPDVLNWLRFERKADGAHVVEVHRIDNAEPQRAVRTGPVPAAFAVAPGVLRSYAGKYQTETLAVTIALGDNGQLTAIPAGQEPLPLRPVSETEFRVEGTPMRIVFHPEAGGVDRFTLHRGARELHGRRIPQ